MGNNVFYSASRRADGRYNKIISGNILGDFSRFSKISLISVASPLFESYYKQV